MVGYSELVNTMAAMVIFSMILLSANRMIQRNTVMQVQGELEQEVVALAQDIIEEARTKEFDENSQGEAPPVNIPGDFSTPGSLGYDNGADTNDDANGDGEVKRKEFDDFDDYNGWTDVLETEHGEFGIEAKVFYVDDSNYEKITASESTFKKIQVFITSKFLTNNAGEQTLYRLEFIRNYYAD